MKTEILFHLESLLVIKVVGLASRDGTDEPLVIYKGHFGHRMMRACTVEEFLEMVTSTSHRSSNSDRAQEFLDLLTKDESLLDHRQIVLKRLLVEEGGY